MYKIYLKFHEDLLSGCRDMGGTKSHRNGQIVIINRIGVCVCYYTIPNNEELSRSYKNYNQRRRKSSVTDTTCIIIQQDINQTLTFDET